jgi:hypothetical protein
MTTKLQFELDVKNADALRKALDLSDSMRDGFKPMIESVSEIQKKVKELALVMNDKDNPFNKKDGGSLIKRYAGEKFKEEADALVENLKKIKAAEKDLWEQRQSLKEKFEESGSREDMKAATSAEVAHNEMRSQRINTEMQSWAQGKGSGFYQRFQEGNLGLGEKYSSLNKFGELQGKGLMGRMSDAMFMNTATGNVISGFLPKAKAIGAAVGTAGAIISAGDALSQSFGSMTDRGFAAERNIGLQAGREASSGDITTLALQRLAVGQRNDFERGRLVEKTGAVSDLTIGNAMRTLGMGVDSVLGTSFGGGGVKDANQIYSERIAKKIATDKATYQPIFESVGQQELQFGGMFGNQEMSIGRIRQRNMLQSLAVKGIDASSAAPYINMLSGYGQTMTGYNGGDQVVRAGMFGTSMGLMNQAARLGGNATDNILEQERRVLGGTGIQNVDVRSELSDVIASRMGQGSGAYSASAGNDIIATMNRMGYNRGNLQQGNREDVRVATNVSDIMGSTNDFQKTQQLAFLASKGIYGTAASDILSQGITSRTAMKALSAATGQSTGALSKELDQMDSKYAMVSAAGSTLSEQNVAYWKANAQQSGQTLNSMEDVQKYVAAKTRVGNGKMMREGAGVYNAIGNFAQDQEAAAGDTGTGTGRYEGQGEDESVQSKMMRGKSRVQMETKAFADELQKLGMDVVDVIQQGFATTAEELAKTRQKLNEDKFK